MRILFSVFTFFLFSTITVQAQTIDGHVFSRTGRHKQPLPYAYVHWQNAVTGVVCDSLGHFSIAESPGIQWLIASAIGYDNDSVLVQPGTKPEIILEAVKTLRNVNVTGKLSSTYLSSVKVQQQEVITSKTLLKAACCNLAESFETNPSVEANFTDAITGMKQIRLLGLQGIYTQMMFENIPNLRGLAGYSGLSFIPGTWIESIQVSKGAGSVANGYESMAGQINLELIKPTTKEKLYVNAYGDNMSRTELNLNVKKKVNEHLNTILLTHADGLFLKADRNKDGFLDNPLGQQLTFSNRWDYNSGKKLESQFGVTGLWNHRTGGQVAFNPETDRGTTNHYGYGTDIKRIVAYAKAGLVFPKKPYRSFGSQYQFVHHQQQSYFGLRNYDGTENSFYTNLIYQDILGNTNHKYRAGFSFLYDDFHEHFMDSAANRAEIVPGIFGEYTYTWTDKLTIQSGLRLDKHNLYGWMFTPRIHIRYAPAEHTVFRISAGKGYRTPNAWIENAGWWVSSRQIIYLEKPQQEVSWNYGISLLQNFKWFQRDGHFSADYYYTQFKNQYIADADADRHKVYFYNLHGLSYAHSVQAEVGYEVVKNLSVLAAYKYSDVKLTETEGLVEKALTPRSRALLTATYSTRFEKWMFDMTTARHGESRLPSGEDDKVSYSPAFYMLNVQITRNFKHWSIYAGSENITNYTQKNPIVAADQPFGPDFDAGMIWGPIEGRKIYAGLRFKIK